MPFVRALILLCVCSSVALAEQDLRLLDGKIVRGQVTGLTPKQVTVQTQTDPVTVPLAQLLEIQLNEPEGIAKDTKYHILQLFDYSELYCSSVVFKGKKVEATLLTGSKLTLPLASVVGWLRDAQDKNSLKQYREFAKKKAAKDRLMILREGELNPLGGVVKNIAEDGSKVEFELAPGRVLPVLFERINGFLFFNSEVSETEPVCMVVDITGSTMAAAKISLKEKTYTVTTLSGDELTLAEATLAKLDFSSGKLRYLSDMPFTVLELKEFGGNKTLISEGFMIKKDSGLGPDDEVLKIGTKTYKKGLAVQLVDLEFLLNGKFKTFKADVGRHAGFSPILKGSQPLLTIRCDGVVVHSKTVQPGEPTPLAINISDVNKMQITISLTNNVDEPFFFIPPTVLGKARVTQ